MCGVPFSGFTSLMSTKSPCVEIVLTMDNNQLLINFSAMGIVFLYIGMLFGIKDFFSFWFFIVTGLITPVSSQGHHHF